MKRCSKCRQRKPRSEFSKDRSRKDGLQNRCKPCNRKIVKKWAKENPDKKRENDRAHELTNRERHPEKYKARHKVRDRVAKGTMVKPKRCEGCRRKFPRHLLQGHHQNYSKPLEIEWLCEECHEEADLHVA